MREVYMGNNPKTWNKNKKIKYITFCVTDSCNLACTYCYFTHKSDKRRMNFETACRAIDKILDDKIATQEYEGVIWDFIGGEPTLELDLITKICDYILISMFKLRHKWLFCYRFMIGTNGLLYSSDKMQTLLQRHQQNISVAMTIDGTKEKHDLSRKKRDGSGSYDDVEKNAKLWIEQQSAYSTKATFAHDDLPYLKDSIVHLWGLGLRNVMANVVFENVWYEGDDEILYSQLISLADYVIDNELWDRYSVRFFSKFLGMPITDSAASHNNCGTGSMLTIDADGNFYPCVRFMDSALNNKHSLKIGNIEDGINYDKIRAFQALDFSSLSSEECKTCEISNECSWCSGFNYDESAQSTIFQRATYQCKMHKATVKACRYFWNRYEEATGEMSPRRYNEYTNQSSRHKYMYIILSDDAESFCHYNAKRTDSPAIMSPELLNKVIKYCEDNNFTPIFLGADNDVKHFGIYINSINQTLSNRTLSIVSIDCDDLIKFGKRIPQFSEKQIILRISPQNLGKLPLITNSLISNNEALDISVKIKNMEEMKKENIILYDAVLSKIRSQVVDAWKSENYVNINIITHLSQAMIPHKCISGDKGFAIAPNGKFYICPAFYFENAEDNIGDIDRGIDLSYQPLCSNKRPTNCKQCDNYQCDSCVYMNKRITGELGVPGTIQCLLSTIEKKHSVLFLDEVEKMNLDLPFKLNSEILRLNTDLTDPLTKKPFIYV